MKKISIYAFMSLLSALLIFAGCDNGDGGDDPQPVSLVFNLQSGTFNGTAISPLPSYLVTLNWDADGNPNGYTVGSSSNAQFTPTVGSSGDFSISGSTITFSNTSGDSRSVSITAGTISPTTTTFTVEWELTKVDDDVTFEEEGTYEYVMAVQ